MTLAFARKPTLKSLRPGFAVSSLAARERCREHLELIAVDEDLVRAEINDLAQLGRKLDAAVLAAWPPALIDSDTLAYTLKQLEGHPKRAC